jgi:glutaredoxin-like YruB-family protein
MITVYSTPACPWCHKIKEFLKSNNKEFNDVDVSKDKAKAMEMIEKSGQLGVPVTDVDGKIIVGFNQDALKQALGLHGKDI